MNTEEVKYNIMRNKNLTDMEKLQLVFDRSKTELKERNPQLYYAILAVLDANKKVQTQVHKEPIPDYQEKQLTCARCGETRSVKYKVVNYNGFEIPICNKCITLF